MIARRTRIGRPGPTADDTMTRKIQVHQVDHSPASPSPATRPAWYSMPTCCRRRRCWPSRVSWQQCRDRLHPVARCRRSYGSRPLLHPAQRGRLRRTRDGGGAIRAVAAAGCAALAAPEIKGGHRRHRGSRYRAGAAHRNPAQSAGSGGFRSEQFHDIVPRALEPVEPLESPDVVVRRFSTSSTEKLQG